MTYSEFTRVQAFIAYQKNGGRLRAAAREVKISPSTLFRWKSTAWWAKECNGSRGHKGRTNRKQNSIRKNPRKLTEDVIEEVKRFYENNESALQIALQYHLKNVKDIDISLSSVCRAIKMAGLSRKRLSSHILGKQSDEKIVKFDNDYKPFVNDLSVVIVSTDEMYASEKVIPTHVYSTVGTKRSLTKHKSGGWKQRSLIQSIASDGSKYHEIVNGTVNRNRFVQYITNLPYPAGTVILMDNCSIHKNIEETLQAKGYVAMFLPPYSPEFQPVEFAFSKIKNAFRSQYPWPDGVEEALEISEKTITSENIVNFFSHTFKNLENSMERIKKIN